MKFFTRKEFFAVLIILSFIAFFSVANFRVALRRARDSERKVDLGNIYNALNAYHRDFGFFPHSSLNGEIKACKPDNFQDLIAEANLAEQFNTEEFLEGLRDCGWGKDALKDLIDEQYAAYLEVIPQDPSTKKGISYFYLANSNRFQIYAYLEGEEDEVGFDETIKARNLPCGDKICNFGRAYANTPLDKSIEEYENELLQKN